MKSCSFDITWNANHVISKLKWKTTILNGNPIKKAVHLTHNLDSTGHVILILHDGRSCNINIKTTYQPILAVTDLVQRKKENKISGRDAHYFALRRLITIVFPKLRATHLGVCMLVPKLEWTPYWYGDSPIWNIDISLPIPIWGSPYQYGVPILSAVPIWG